MIIRIDEILEKPTKLSTAYHHEKAYNEYILEKIQDKLSEGNK